MLKFVVRYAFHEKQFITQFLQSPSNSVFHSELHSNIQNVQNLNTLISFLDQSYKHNQLIVPELLQSILKQATKIIDLPHNQEFIKGFFLTLTLNRIENRILYEKIIENTIKNIQQFQEDHLITIIESIIYNRLHLKYKIGDTKIKQFYEQLAHNLSKNDMHLQNQQLLTNLPKLINLSCQYRYNILIHEILATIYQLLYQLRQPQNQISAEYLNSLLQTNIIIDSMENFTKIKEMLSEQRKQCQKLKQQYLDIVNENFSDETLLNTTFSKQHIQSIQNYVKKYPKAPPQILPKQILNLIGNVYTSLVHDFNKNSSKSFLVNLGDFNNFSYFLSKTHKQFNLSDDDYKIIQQLVSKESNLFNLAKTLEIISTTVQNHNDLFHNPNHKSHHHHPEHPKLRNTIVKQIEVKIDTLMKNHLNPADSLVIAFQSLVRLDDYEPQLANLLEYFSYGNVLYRLKWQDLIVKLIPSVGILTKKMTKQFYMEFQQQRSDQLKLLTDTWDKILQVLIKKFSIIEQDKIPVILFYLSYASNLDLKQNYDFFHICKANLDFTQFNQQQISELYYAYSRINYQDSQFYNQIINQIQDQHINQQQITLFLAGLPMNKVITQQFIDKLQNSIDLKQFDDKLQLSYLQCLITFQFTPLPQLISYIQQSFKKSKDNEYIIGCASSLLQYDTQSDILNIYLDFCQKNNKIFIKSPFYAHELHLLYQKLVLQDKYPKDQLDPIYKLLTDAKLSLAKYHISLKQMKSSKMEQDIVKQLKELQLKDEDIGYYFINDVIEDPTRLTSIDQLIPYQIDYRIGRYCFEINGPKHYIIQQGTKRLDGQTQRKKALLESIGFKYIEIDFETYESNGVKCLLEQLN